jgi:hypothetical protein
VQRLRLDALQDQAGRLYLHGRPFNGVAYEVKSDRVTANYRVTEGLLGGTAEAWDPDRPRVLFPALTLVSVDETDERFPEEGAYLDGLPFHGIAYAFDQDTGVLLQEQDCHPTQAGPSREWYPSGALRAEFHRAREDGTNESETWYENEQRATIESLHLGVDYTPEGRLRTLRLEPGYPENDLDQLTFRADSRLGLYGEGVTDELLERLVDLPRVEHLELCGTGISAKGLKRFRACTNLKKLKTPRSSGFGLADVQDLLAHLPGCAWDGRLT